MAKYTVEMRAVGFLYADVEASSEDEAIEIASELYFDDGEDIFSLDGDYEVEILRAFQ